MDHARVGIVFVSLDDFEDVHDRVQVDDEHGGTWVTCLDCGAQWSVHEVDGDEEFDFERVSEGDGYCDEKSAS